MDSYRTEVEMTQKQLKVNKNHISRQITLGNGSNDRLPTTQQQKYKMRKTRVQAPFTLAIDNSSVIFPVRVSKCFRGIVDLNRAPCVSADYRFYQQQQQ